MRILVLGDSHGDAEFILRGLRVARREGCSVVFQVGDFGCYENIQGGIDFLRRVEAGVEDVGIPLYFLDGNHDGMVPLWRDYGLMVGQDDISDGGISYVDGCSRGEFVEIRKDRIFYAPRGHTWEWDGTKFMAVGGAFSINRAHMMPEIEWWEQEEITQAQVDYIIERIESDGVDVMLTHDTPHGFPLPAIEYKKEYPEAALTRKRLLQLVEAAKPALLVHGHYHSRYGNWFTTPGGHRMRVEGLGANRTAEIDEPWAVIETRAP